MQQGTRTNDRQYAHNVLDDDDVDLLKWAVRKGKTKTRIAAWLGISRRHIYRLIERYGL